MYNYISFAEIANIHFYELCILDVLKHINYEFRLFSGFLLPRLFIYYRFCECGLGKY